MLKSSIIFWKGFNFFDEVVYFLIFKFIVDWESEKNTCRTVNYIYLIIISCISFFIEFNEMLIHILLCYIFYKLNYNESNLKCILYSSVYSGIVYKVIDYVSLSLVFILNYSNIFEIDVIDANIVIIETSILKTILMIIVSLIYMYINRLHRHKELSNMIIFIPIIINVLILVLIFRYIALGNQFVNKGFLKLIIIPSLILISTISFIIILRKIVNSYNIKNQNKVLIDNVHREYNYYYKINNEQNKVKEIYHDMKNNMICIRDMCENNENEKLLNYIDNIELGLDLKKYSYYNQEIYTGNMIVDSILKNKKAVCKEKLIEVDANIDFSRNSFMDMTDICIIFSNIIDNAIEACDNIVSNDIDKKIKIESKYVDQFCIIVIENTKINEIKKENNKILTSKLDSCIHGIGLKNVKNAVRKYSGEVDIEYSNDRFVLKIMIPCN